MVQSRQSVERAALHWRTRTLLPLAESVLANAVYVREANVLCMRLGLHVRVQLAIVRAWPAQHTRSKHDGLVHDLRTQESQKIACVVARVIDMDACTLETWSCAFLVHQVHMMRRMCAMDKRVLRDVDVHAQVVGSMPPLFVHIGHVFLPLDACSLRMPIVPTYGGNALGSCTVELVWLADGRACRLVVRDMEGLTFRYALQVHWQVCLGSYTYATQPVSVDEARGVSLHHTFKKPSDTQWPRALIIMLFAKPTRTLLTEIEAHDQAQEVSAMQGSSTYAAPDVLQTLKIHGAMEHRRHERDRQWEQTFVTLVSVYMEEGASGAQAVVPLHSTSHGNIWIVKHAPTVLVCVTLTQETKSAVPWSGIDWIQVGDVSLRDAHGVVRARDERFVPVQRIHGPNSSDKTMFVSAAWRIATHDIPPPHIHTDTIHATLRIGVACSQKEKRAITYDVPVSLHWNRDTNQEPDVWTVLDPGTQQAQLLYLARWTPQSKHSVADLWRLDTRNVQVPGCEMLGSWHVRGMSLIRDYYAELIWETDAINGVPHGKVPPWPLPLKEDAFADLRSHWRSVCALPRPTLTGTTTVLTMHTCLRQGWLTMQTDARRDAWSRFWAEVHDIVLTLHRAKNTVVQHAIYLHRVHIQMLSNDPCTFVLYTSSASYVMRTDADDADAPLWMYVCLLLTQPRFVPRTYVIT